MARSSVVRTSPDTCVITCLYCAQATTLPTSLFRLGQKPPHVRCACGRVFRFVRLDRRRFPRKPVELSGTLLEATTHTPLIPVSIIDLSLDGLRFATSWSSLDIGDHYRIVFRLDDAVQTEICEKLVIRRVHTDETVGAEFVHPECEEALDFYLTPWAVQP